MEYSDTSGTFILIAILITISMFTIAIPIGEYLFRKAWGKPSPNAPLKWAALAVIFPIIILLIECSFLTQINGHGIIKQKYYEATKYEKLYDDQSKKEGGFYLVIQVGGFMGDIGHFEVLEHEYQRIKIGQNVKAKYVITRLTGSIFFESIN